MGADSLGESGKVLLSVRDSSGFVSTDFNVINDGEGPYLKALYVRGNGQLIAAQDECGPAPELRVVEVNATQLLLEKLDHINEWNGYTLVIETESGSLSQTWMQSCPTRS